MSSVKNEEVKQLLDQFNQQNQSHFTFRDGIDAFVKVLVTLSTVGIVWVGSQINSLDRKIIEIDANQRYLKEQMVNANQLLRQPRFTKDDFLLEMKVYEQRVTLAESELNSRSNLMADVEERLRSLEKVLHELTLENKSK